MLPWEGDIITMQRLLFNPCSGTGLISGQVDIEIGAISDISAILAGSALLDNTVVEAPVLEAFLSFAWLHSV